MTETSTTYDVIVIGAGIMGLSSALYCQKAGLRVLLLEQFSFPHTRGSSHGGSRITRKAYLESPEISKMMDEAHSLWRQIEKETNSELYHRIGTLYIEQGPAPAMHSIAAVNDRLGYEYTMLNEEGLADRYGKLFNFPGYSALLDHDGGLLRADLCCSKIFNLFRSLGGEFVDLAPVERIKTGSPVEVVTQSGTIYHGRKLIVSAGPWSVNLKQMLNLELPLQPEAVSVCYWNANDKTAYTPDKFPCFYDVTSTIYALPSFEYHGMIKLVHPKTNEKCLSPETRDSNPNNLDALMKIYTPYMEAHFPNVQRPPAIIDRCMYTRTPDDMWIIDKHPSHDNIVVLAGFSGHGFKAGPLVGKLASELINGQCPGDRYNMNDFSISRFK